MTHDCKGILVHDREAKDDAVCVTVLDRRRIAALKDAADRHLSPTDEVVTVLAAAVADGLPDVELPECWDEHDAKVLAGVLDDMRNGNDGAGNRAAEKLRTAWVRERIDCPYCDGTGRSDN